VRKTTVALLAACIAGIAAHPAGASPRFRASFRLTYLSRHTGVSTGLTTVMTWSDPGAPLGVPKVIKRIRLRFQPGTRFDTTALPTCRASDPAIRARGAAACPPTSRLGSGSTVAVSSSGAQFTTQVTLFNAARQIIVVVTLNGAVVTEFRDQVQTDLITVNPALPPGISLKRLSLRIDPHATGRGTARRVYMRTPPTCPASRHWTVMGEFTYMDRSRQDLTSTTPCQ
jgi:hypothetical protein